MTIRDNRQQPMKIQPQDSGDAVDQQVETNSARDIVGVTPEEAPAKRSTTQGPSDVTPVGVAPVDR